MLFMGDLWYKQYVGAIKPLIKKSKWRVFMFLSQEVEKHSRIKDGALLVSCFGKPNTSLLISPFRKNHDGLWLTHEAEKLPTVDLGGMEWNYENRQALLPEGENPDHWVLLNYGNERTICRDAVKTVLSEEEWKNLVLALL
jgi:hypothetical protein